MTEQVADAPVVDTHAVVDAAPVVDPVVADTPAAIEYTDFAIPENVELADGVLDSFKALAKEQGLNQEQAQKFMDLQTGQYTKAKESWANTVNEWQESAKNDAEFGQAKFDESKLLAQQTLDKFHPEPEFKEFLESTGLGNHPSLVRLLVRVGKSISNDSFVDGSKHDGKSKDPAKVFYDKTL
jgi:hypothetical protein